MIRKSIIAGSWYPGQKDALIKDIDTHFLHPQFGPGELIISKETQPRTILGGISPHAGYLYSGAAAAHTYSQLFSESCPDVVIILGTTHTGYHNIACMKEGSWETPFGLIDVHSELASELIKSSDTIINDVHAFADSYHGRNEHNIEIQLPFIQYAAEKYQKQVSIIPIKIGVMTPTILQNVAESIASVIKSYKNKLDIVLVASSDLSHEQPRVHGSVDNTLKFMQKTDYAIRDAVNSLDEDSLFSNAIKASVCGPQTMFTVMKACKLLGATKGNALKYYTSHDKVPDYSPSQIVGYLSAVFST